MRIFVGLQWDARTRMKVGILSDSDVIRRLNMTGPFWLSD